MAEYSTPEERTEMPTDRRMNQLRKEGALHCSVEVVHVVSLLSGFAALCILWPYLYNDMVILLKKSYQLIAMREPITVEMIMNGFIGLLYLFGPHLGILMIFTASMAALAVFLQTNWNIKEKKIHFKFDQLNPLSGMQRIFSIQGFVTTFKAILKLVIILPMAYFGIREIAPGMLQLVHMPVNEIFRLTGEGMAALFWKIMYILIAIAIFDFVWGKYQWLRNNKMTKEEVKDERKAVEGDEATKRQIQAKGLARIAQRIRESVPKATVVVTNPTHLAVALKYDRETMAAPVVVAKGKGFLAERIKLIAKGAGVPVLERKPLARALFESVEVGSMIPRELFRAVAEVLAYLYKLRNPYAQTAGAEHR